MIDRDAEAAAQLAAARAVADSLTAAASALHPRVLVVLGSGLDDVIGGTEVAATLSFADVPGFPPPTVEGHAGRFVLGSVGGTPVLMMQGRLHLYEGRSPATVVLGVRAAKLMGAQALVVTNAAGGVNLGFAPGDIMLITDHLNLTGTSPLLGPNLDELGPRFPGMTGAYDLELQTLARTMALELGEELREGVYAGLLGPAYETPAEVRMLRSLGADAVGMSTVLEVIAARHMGMRVLGLSLVTNMAAGGTHGHAEVLETSARRAPVLAKLVAGILTRL
jgi:purine-nucleoside phosphorylase